METTSEVPASGEHQVFRIQCRGLIAYLKISGDMRITPELAVLQLLTTHGVPVPVIEAADPDGAQTGVPCVLIRHVGGTPLSHDSPEFGATGQLLRRVHDIALDGFGSVIWHPAGSLRGHHDAWQDTVERSIQGVEPIADAGLIDTGLLWRAITAVEDNASELNAPSPGRLLHGDFHPRHVYAESARITGIIDWADASSGDPLYDFGRILHSGALAKGLSFGVESVNLVRQTYGEAPWLQDDPIRQLLIYGVIFTLSAMRSEFAGGSPWPPWWPAQARALAAMLDAL